MLSRRAAASSDLALCMTHIIKLTPTIAFFLRRFEREAKRASDVVVVLRVVHVDVFPGCVRVRKEQNKLHEN
jgi:hypothetical protein